MIRYTSMIVKWNIGLFSVLIAANAALQDQKLEPWQFTPSPVGSVRPSGWLLSELESMKRGLPGHEYTSLKGGDGHLFYSFVRENPWLEEKNQKVSSYSNLHEELPYWFNGLVPLAYLLDDADLRNQVVEVASNVLDKQKSDGWIGPELAGGLLWGRYPFFLGLIQLAEADPSQFRTRVLSSLHKFMPLAHEMLKNHGYGYSDCPVEGSKACSWGQVRAADLMITIQWLLENDPQDQGPMLWEVMTMLHDMNKYKWEDWYTDNTYQWVVENPRTDNPAFPYLAYTSTNLTTSPGLKYPAAMYRFTRNETFLTTLENAVSWTMAYHGSPSGSVLGDEIMTDNEPYRGSELCTAVETGYSLAYLYQANGSNAFADLAERTYFNALPVMVSGDGWGHQYMDQPNQPFVSYFKHWDIFTTANTGMATVFGLEPVYPCCTVYHPQGFPKFVTHSWARVGDNGVAHTLLGPTKINTTVGGKRVSVDCHTSYPFSQKLEYHVNSETGFILYLKVPGWHVADRSSIAMNGEPAIALVPDSFTGMHQMSVTAGQSTVTLTLGAEPRTESRANSAVSVYVGSLLFALDVGQTESSSDPHKYGHPGQSMNYLPFPEVRDYYYQNQYEWNVAIDPATLDYHGLGGDEDVVDGDAFVYDKVKTYINVQGCTVDWELLRKMTPGPPPANPKCVGERKTYRMIPYGAAKIHMSELPVVHFG
ncbi:hypothetical protein F4778DRAFT_72529 [Xylariomycetidae sp. FL2044]|nr:hypothetical protein F4778DRAFT_72529 [Xylariomycetidae sp. FL2044]